MTGARVRDLACLVALAVGLWLLYGCEEGATCVEADSYDGWTTCDAVELCQAGEVTWYRGLDGTLYDCPANSDACLRLLCDRCDLDAGTRAAVC